MAQPVNELSAIPLTRLRKGTSGTVVSIDADSAHERGKLMALGVMPGTTLRLLQRFPSYIIQIGYTQLALDKESAATILVQQDSAGIVANERE